MNVFDRFFTLLLVLTMSIFGLPSILVDCDPETPGIQKTLYLDGTEEYVFIDFVADNFEKVTGYQFTMTFDSSKLSFEEGKDGTLKNKNILKKNGGSIIGIANLQVNPPAKDIVDFAFSISNATEAMAVSESGMLGYVAFSSKMKEGDTCVIEISKGGWAYLNSNLNLITSYEPGRCIFAGTGIVESNAFNYSTLNLYATSGNNSGILPQIHFIIPESFKQSSQYSIKLFDTKGQLIANVANGMISPGRYTVNLEEKVGRHISSSGLYLCNVEIEKISRTIKIWHD